METIKTGLLIFEERYLLTVGVMYAELDKIKAQILEIVARCYPLDEEAGKRVAEACDQARESARATEFIEQHKKQKHLMPSDELKKLYREAARTMHPDLTTNEEARVARQKMMVQINLAYENGDAERLRLLLRRWLKSPESVEGEVHNNGIKTRHSGCKVTGRLSLFTDFILFFLHIPNLSKRRKAHA